MPPPLIRQGSRSDNLWTLSRRSLFVLIPILVLYASIWILFLVLNPNGSDPIKVAQSENWIATSHSWLDRFSCRRIGVCGGLNWLTSTRVFHHPSASRRPQHDHNHSGDWLDSDADPDSWNDAERKARHIPSYVYAHAPLVYLHEEERWWPSDVADFLYHVEIMRPGDSRRRRVKLGDFATHRGSELTSEWDYLQSVSESEGLPAWLACPHNIPTARNETTQESSRLASPMAFDVHLDSALALNVSTYGKEGSRNRNLFPESAGASLFQKKISRDSSDLEEIRPNNDIKLPGATANRSSAPAFLITVAKGNGTLDAFWFFFYAFNRGARVAGIQYGNHIGDWEHVLVRFVNGTAQQVFLSAHEWGSAYNFDALEQSPSYPGRPLVYAGLGSHAHYATEGKHAYALPFGLLGDDCSKGRLWDPTLNLHSYVYRSQTSESLQATNFLASMENPRSQTAWLDYRGRWGDPRRPLSGTSGGNYRFAGEYKFLDGPTGPWDKALERIEICEHAHIPCVIRKTPGGYVGPVKGLSR